MERSAFAWLADARARARTPAAEGSRASGTLRMEPMPAPPIWMCRAEVSLQARPTRGRARVLGKGAADARYHRRARVLCTTHEAEIFRRQIVGTVLVAIPCVRALVPNARSVYRSH